MKYEVTNQVNGIAVKEDVSVSSIVSEMGLEEMDGSIYALDRSSLCEVYSRLTRINVKTEVKKVEEKKASIIGYHWVKDEEGWAVAGDFSGKREGDVITVARRDGTKQSKMIERFSYLGNAYVG